MEFGTIMADTFEKQIAEVAVKLEILKVSRPTIHL